MHQVDKLIKTKKFSILPTIKQVISIIQALLVNLFYGNQEEATRITAAIFSTFPKLVKTRNIFPVYLLNLMALANARINPGKKTDQMERILINLFNDVRLNPTLYTQSVLTSLKAEQSRNRKEFELALAYAEESLQVFKRNNMVINELLTYNLIINIYKELGNNEKIKEYTYIKLALLNKKKVSLSLF